MTFKEFFDEYKKGQKSFGDTIAIIINTILLTLVYAIGVGITSIIARIAGKSFLDLKMDKERKSYWTKLDLNKKKEDYFRQF